MDDGPGAIFVYGTLMPGHLRWPMVEPHALTARPARVPGRLFDTGLGWPAAVIDQGAVATVPGVLVEIRPDRLDELVVVLDDVEDVGSGLYERVRVRPKGLGAAWAWSYAQPVDGFRSITAWTDQPER